MLKLLDSVCLCLLIEELGGVRNGKIDMYVNKKFSSNEFEYLIRINFHTKKVTNCIYQSNLLLYNTAGKVSCELLRLKFIGSWEPINYLIFITQIIPNVTLYFYCVSISRARPGMLN